MQDQISTILIIALELFIIIVPTSLIIILINLLIKKSAFFKNKLGDILDSFGKKIKLSVIFISFMLCLSAIVVNGWFLYKGVDPKGRTLELIEKLPPNIWFLVAKTITLLVGLIILGYIFIKVLRKVILFLCEKAKLFEGLKANNQSIEQAFSSLENLLVKGSWIFVLAYSSKILLMPENITKYCFTFLNVYVIVSVGILCWKILDVIIDSLDELSKKYSHSKDLFTYYERLKTLMPIFRRAVEYILYLFFTTMAMRQFDFLLSLANWGPRLIKIIGIAFLSRFLFELVKLLVEEMFITRSKSTNKARQSRLTLVPLMTNLLRYLIYFGAIILILDELGIDPFPILAGAGIVGLAIGLGAQGLMKDIVSGFSILLENYFLVGDYVSINGDEGFVESIDISNTRLIDEEGRLHIFKNGDINKIVNFSKEHSCAIVEVRVSYECKIDNVKEVILGCNDTIKSTCKGIIDGIEFQGIEKFEDIGMVIRTLTKTKAGMHLEAERQIREILKSKFDDVGIRIPYSWGEREFTKKIQESE